MIYLLLQAEKLNINFVPKNSLVGVLSKEEKIQVKKLQEINNKFLRIPRRFVLKIIRYFFPF